MIWEFSGWVGVFLISIAVLTIIMVTHNRHKTVGNFDLIGTMPFNLAVIRVSHNGHETVGNIYLIGSMAFNKGHWQNKKNTTNCENRYHDHNYFYDQERSKG